MLGWLGLVVLLVAIGGCDEGDSSPIGPSAPPSPLACGLGPISLPSNRPQPCPTIAPRCPLARPAGAPTLLVVSTCSYAQGAAPCTPVQTPLCPRPGTMGPEFILAPAPGAPPSICVGRVGTSIEPTAEGGAILRWHAQEEAEERGTCREVGSPIEGSVTVSGPCCERVADIYLPNGRFTFRLAVRTDWQE